MGRQSASPPSKFWERLTEAFKERGLPITQRGVARLVGKKQASAWEWYHGISLPELTTCREIAVKGGVCVDWLITGRLPKYPISKDPLLSKILEGYLSLNEEGRKRILQAVRKEQIQKTARGSEPSC